MTRKHTFIFAIALVVVTGCSSAPKKHGVVDAAHITYRLPDTAVQINVGLTLVGCAPIKARAEVALAPAITPGTEHFRLDGAKLASLTKKRELDVSLYPNGSIKSVNGTVSDRTGAILVSAIKIAGTIALAAAPPTGTSKQLHRRHCECHKEGGRDFQHNQIPQVRVKAEFASGPNRHTEEDRRMGTGDRANQER